MKVKYTLCFNHDKMKFNSSRPRNVQRKTGISINYRNRQSCAFALAQIANTLTKLLCSTVCSELTICISIIWTRQTYSRIATALAGLRLCGAFPKSTLVTPFSITKPGSFCVALYLEVYVKSSRKMLSIKSYRNLFL